ncbi:MAG: hypothetical protein M1817_002619 [Caeruleum heppii]|nr:MAG: hypothetical protein M1817_002619 [Caeruleum heppii]
MARPVLPPQQPPLNRLLIFIRRLPRRWKVLFALLLSLLTFSAVLLTSPSSIPTVPTVANLSDHLPDHIPRPKLPKLTVPNIRNPFRPTAHQPPVQANSTSGEAKWYSDWKWLNPFSSSITLDENRSVLPPLRKRPHIYTFYDTSEHKDEPRRAAEHELLLIWRRAWWAQGFRPIILGRPEAMSNPLYEKLQFKNQANKLESALEAELARWLAWEHMGAGVLANWLALPMGAHDDPLLSYLRRGEYPKLTRYETLGTGLFSGEQAAISAALKQALDSPDLAKSKSFLDLLPKETFDVDPAHDSIAYYDAATLTAKYKLISDKIAGLYKDGMLLLAQLINSHLHTTFQNTFTKGVAVLKPLPKHTTALTRAALRIAHSLAECNDTPLPASCPPNRPKCNPCVSAHPLKIDTPFIFRNTSTLYTIGTVPHPYTLASLHHQRPSIDRGFIRRSTDRDPWILAATKELMGTGVGGAPRVVRFKEAVASDYGRAHSLWLVAETSADIAANADEALNWHFGFALPSNITDKGLSTPPVPGSKPNIPLGTTSSEKDDAKLPTHSELAHENSLLQKSIGAVQSRAKPMVAVREMVEAWNMADAEAWRFLRAYSAREGVERDAWEREEGKFVGGRGKGIEGRGGRGRGRGWRGWLD